MIFHFAILNILSHLFWIILMHLQKSYDTMVQILILWNIFYEWENIIYNSTNAWKKSKASKKIRFKIVTDCNNYIVKSTYNFMYFSFFPKFRMDLWKLMLL